MDKVTKPDLEVMPGACQFVPCAKGVPKATKVRQVPSGVEVP